MRIPFAHVSPTLVESPPDGGLALVFFVSLVVIIRYSLRLAQASLEEKSDLRTLMKLVAVCVFAGFCALARFALIFYEWSEASQVFGYYESVPLYYVTQMGVFWIYMTLALAVIGVVVCFFALNLGRIVKSRLGGFIIRNGWKFAGLSILLLSSWAVLELRVKPVINERSLLENLAGSNGLDAYLEPKEVRLYKVMYPSFRDERIDEENWSLAEEEWEKVRHRYHGFRIASRYETLDPDSVAKELRKLFVFQSRSFDTKNASYLIRFIGDATVLDLWLSERREIEVYSSVLLSDYEAAVGFKLPYDLVMEQSIGGGLKYDAGRGHVLELFLDRIERLEG